MSYRQLEMTLANFPVEMVGLSILFVWLAVETYWDLKRSVMLPLWLVLPPVVIGVLSQALYGHWLTAMAIIVAVLLHLSDTLLVRAIGTALLIGGALYAGSPFLAAGFALYWILWEVHITGGADALAAYAVLMVVPRDTMFWALLAGIFVWGVVGMVIVYRSQLVQRVRTMIWRITLRELPKETELDEEGKPTLGSIWLGVVFYLGYLGWLAIR